MSAVGPELPPHLLAKRKRQLEEEEQSGATAAPGAKRARSPPLEPARKVGPAPPPAPLEERPDHAPEDSDASDSSDDDDFGPALPSANDHKSTYRDDEETKITHKATAPSTGPKRDDWMTMPPTQDDLASRLDPSRPRPRGFNTGKGASASAGRGGPDSTWTETPEQKRKRLENQVMGIATETRSASTSTDMSEARAKARQEEERERAAAFIMSRGPSLMDMHMKTEGKEAEDDPSARAFDREKDMSVTGVSGKQKREMLSKAAGFGNKFSGGSFL